MPKPTRIAMLAGAAAIIAADGVTARQMSPSLRFVNGKRNLTSWRQGGF